MLIRIQFPVNKLLLIFVFNAFYAKAVIYPSSQGPVSMGMGTLSGFKNNPFAAYNHQGSLAFVNRNSVSLSFQSLYFVEGLNQACLAANYKLRKTQNLGIACSFFGNQYYNEGLFKLSLARKFSSNFGGGIALDYLRLQLPLESYPVQNLLTFEAGIYSSFNSNFDFAFQIINPARVKLAVYNDERLPFIVNGSVFFNSSPKLTLGAEWFQIMNGTGNLKFGINYKVSDKLEIRAGLFNKPVNPCLGITCSSKKIRIHLAFSFHPYLNAASSAGITFLPSHVIKDKL